MSLLPVLTDRVWVQYLIEAKKIKTIMLLLAVLASNKQWNKLNKRMLFQVLK